MTVKELIETLQNNYEPDTELVVAYWDRELVESFLGGKTLSETNWRKFVNSYDEENYSWADSWADQTADNFVEALEEILSE